MSGTVLARPLDRFVAARSLSYVADALKTFVIPVIVFQRTGSAAMSGVALAVEYVPKTVLMPFVGAFSQRLRLRPQFLAVDGVRAALCGALLLAHSVGALMAVSALIAVFTSYAYVLNESLVAVAFAGGERTVAQARLQAADQIARVAGPALGAVLYAYSVHGVLLLATGLFVLCGLGLFGLPRGADRVVSSVRRNVLGGIARGARVVGSSPVLARMTFLLVGTNFAGGVVLALAPPAIAQTFGLPLAYFGLLGAVASAASAGVMLVIGRVAKNGATAGMARASLAAIAVALVLVTAAPNFVTFASGYALLTVGNICYATYVRVERLRFIPPDALGETIGLLTSLIWLSVPLSGLVVALMVKPAGLRLTMLAASAVTILCIAVLQGSLGGSERARRTPYATAEKVV